MVEVGLLLASLDSCDGSMLTSHRSICLIFFFSKTDSYFALDLLYLRLLPREENVFINYTKTGTVTI